MNMVNIYFNINQEHLNARKRMRSFVMQLSSVDLKNIMIWSSFTINEEGLSTEVNNVQICERYFFDRN